jgi:hypothetical protein
MHQRRRHATFFFGKMLIREPETPQAIVEIFPMGWEIFPINGRLFLR